MTSSSSSPSYRLRPDVRCRVLDGEAVVLRQKDAEVLTLNETATLMLEMLRQGAPASLVVDALVEEFEVDREVLAEDVDAFVREMLEANILEPIEDSGEDDRPAGPPSG